MKIKFSRFIKTWSDLTGLYAVTVVTVTVTALLLGVRHLGGLQTLELMAYDQLVRLRPELGPDPRLLVVGITEKDIQHFKRWPLSDRDIAKLLQKLSQMKAQVIGLDLHRDIPYEPGHQELTVQLKQPNIITIRLIGESGDAQSIGIPAPPGVPASRVGFNDLLLDPDGVVRRNMMTARPEKKTLSSLSLKLALYYLTAQKIDPPQDRPLQQVEWGKALFKPLTAHSGGYQLHRQETRGYQILLDYRSPRRAVRQVSVVDVLTDKVDPNWVKDKIVLIGTVAPSAKDLFLTPYSPSEQKNPKIPGVMIHAQMVSQLLDAVMGDRRLLEFWSEWAEILWIGSWALIGSTWAWCSRHPFMFAVGCPILLTVLGGLSVALFLEYRWVPVAAPALAFICTSATEIAYRAHKAQQQQQIVMRLLGQNTSPEIATALWNSRKRLLEDGKLPGQRVIATILFTDIKDFSTISEQMPPEDLMEWLNEYLGILTEIVQSHRGIVNKFTGDGIMAAFGVPVPRTNNEEIAQDARAAVSCALAIGERLNELNLNWKERGLPVIQMRVGIFTGPIVAGSLGGKNRSEYGLLGDSVNIASRLESCEKDRQPSPCRVLIAHQTLTYIRGEFLVEHWGPLALKGKQKTVDVYHAIGHNQPRKLEIPEKLEEVKKQGP